VHAEAMSRLFTNESLSDVVLVAANGGEFRAHRAILAANSPVNFLNELKKILIINFVGKKFCRNYLAKNF
jgi:hypothetical protein